MREDEATEEETTAKSCHLQHLKEMPPHQRLHNQPTEEEGVGEGVGEDRGLARAWLLAAVNLVDN